MACTPNAGQQNCIVCVSFVLHLVINLVLSLKKTKRPKQEHCPKKRGKVMTSSPHSIGFYADASEGLFCHFYHGQFHKLLILPMCTCYVYLQIICEHLLGNLFSPRSTKLTCPRNSKLTRPRNSNQQCPAITAFANRLDSSRSKSGSSMPTKNAPNLTTLESKLSTLCASSLRHLRSLLAHPLSCSQSAS